ncbi:MAG: hypothetical protein AVDCRST_MAG11-2561 [uncultured Gemmatimonadaceae bacterium]|uniref:Uncharacterized protein n=1 Tax=uncultured Gemmatimonadaceae bacterium TaxID=246130 RepID=A0A6J4LI42_9BACT|nr:MAG: hypothetical protein AVDCRST_MAG11-2561 [uncultured Gemmatimonadaceae bacterium]
MPQEPLGGREELPREAHVLQLVVRDHARRQLVERVDLGAREGEQDRRVGGDHELRALVDEVAEHRQEAELALRRERRLGLVEQVEAARHETRPEEPEEALPVRVGVEVDAVAPLHVAERRAERPLRQAERVRGPVVARVVGLERRELGEHGRAHLREPLRVAEEVLGAQEEAARRAGAAPGEPHAPGEGARARERRVGGQVVAPDRRQPRGGRDRLEPRRLARPVLADEAGDRRAEGDRARGAHRRNGERVGRGGAGAGRGEGDGEEHGGRPLRVVCCVFGAHRAAGDRRWPPTNKQHATAVRHASADRLPRPRGGGAARPAAPAPPAARPRGGAAAAARRAARPARAAGGGAAGGAAGARGVARGAVGDARRRAAGAVAYGGRAARQHGARGGGGARPARAALRGHAAAGVDGGERRRGAAAAAGAAAARRPGRGVAGGAAAPDLPGHALGAAVDVPLRGARRRGGAHRGPVRARGREVPARRLPAAHAGAHRAGRRPRAARAAPLPARPRGRDRRQVHPPRRGDVRLRAHVRAGGGRVLRGGGARRPPPERRGGGRARLRDGAPRDPRVAAHLLRLPERRAARAQGDARGGAGARDPGRDRGARRAVRAVLGLVREGRHPPRQRGPPVRRERAAGGEGARRLRRGGRRPRGRRGAARGGARRVARFTTEDTEDTENGGDSGASRRGHRVVRAHRRLLACPLCVLRVLRGEPPGPGLRAPPPPRGVRRAPSCGQAAGRLPLPHRPCASPALSPSPPSWRPSPPPPTRSAPRGTPRTGGPTPSSTATRPTRGWSGSRPTPRGRSTRRPS